MIEIAELHDFLDRLVAGAGDIDPAIRHLASSGHCDAFALALKDVLAIQFPQVDASIIVVQRRRVSRKNPSRVIDENPLSHVIVDVGSTTVDAFGIDADETWEDEWIQPGKHDEVVPCEDVFDYVASTDEGLTALRQLRDQRDPDPLMRERFGVSLSNVAKALNKSAKATPTKKSPGQLPRR